MDRRLIFSIFTENKLPMLITTTNTIDNATLKEYIGIVTSNVVVGTNLFSDFTASITDVIGGNSETYERKLQGIYKTAIFDLNQKAGSLGANAIVGLHIDFDEISGKGKSMFMVAVSGTAVRFEYNHNDRYNLCEKLYKLKLYYKEGILSNEEYEYEKKKILEDNNNPIQTEVERRNEQIEAQQAQIKRAEEIVALLQEMENNAIKTLQQKPLSFDIDKIKNANYSNIPIQNTASMDECIRIMIKEGAYNEACKYYMDETGLEVADAMEHVKYIYDLLLKELLPTN